MSADRTRTIRPGRPVAVVVIGLIAVAACSGARSDARPTGQGSASTPSSTYRPPRLPADLNRGIGAPVAVSALTPATGPLAPAGSFWRQTVTNAPIAGNSPELVGQLSRQVADNWGGTAAFNAWDFNTTVVTVPADQPRVDVVWDDCQHKGYTPGSLYDATGQFAKVPIPANVRTAGGTDKEITVWSPSTDQLWEFWVATRQADGWHACWGGRMDDVSTGPGYFRYGFGATATGLPNAFGMVSFDDVRRGSIDHAMSLQIIGSAAWWKISWPAQRGDGDGSGSIEEGTRFRLDPAVDVETLGLPPVAKMIARAAQRYGFVVTDRSGAVAVIGEAGTSLTANGRPNPWETLLGDTKSYDLLRGFPWERLQALPHDYGRPSATTSGSPTASPAAG